ncbi:MAG: MCE family protein [Polyangiaceae bacterium]|nr:MCE family protein [Polyangiaceae bacterium]
MANSRSIEVKVGILMLTAVGLLAAFILVMGGINFQPTYSVFVNFDNPGGLQTGAPVKIAGVKVGKIDEIQFRGGKVDEATGRRDPLVRIKVDIEKRYQESVRENSLFYVTTQGVLGEQFLAIEPGTSDSPILDERSEAVRGLDPPRLDLLLSEGYELLHSTVTALRTNKKEIGETFDALRITLKATGSFFGENGDKIKVILDNAEEASEEGTKLLKGVNEKYVENPKVENIIDNVDSITTNLKRDTPALLADARVTLGDAKVAAANTKRFTEAVASEEQTTKIKKAVDGAVVLVDKANTMANDAQYMVTQMRKGRGTVGALLMNEQLFDDLQEMVRDLKHNPWKFFWRE